MSIQEIKLACQESPDDLMALLSSIADALEDLSDMCDSMESCADTFYSNMQVFMAAVASMRTKQETAKRTGKPEDTVLAMVAESVVDERLNREVEHYDSQDQNANRKDMD